MGDRRALIKRRFGGASARTNAEPPGDLEMYINSMGSEGGGFVRPAVVLYSGCGGAQTARGKYRCDMPAEVDSQPCRTLVSHRQGRVRSRRTISMQHCSLMKALWEPIGLSGCSCKASLR